MQCEHSLTIYFPGLRPTFDVLLMMFNHQPKFDLKKAPMKWSNHDAWPKSIWRYSSNRWALHVDQKHFRHKNNWKWSKLYVLNFIRFQIGKGYFVERIVLQAKWKSLGLHEVTNLKSIQWIFLWLIINCLQHELLKFLNVCGMINWERFHWLELFATMVASICKVVLN